MRLGCATIDFPSGFICPLVVAILRSACFSLLAAGPPVETAPRTAGSGKQPITYEIADGRIEIKPRMKYELILSIHVLRCAEDHHQIFTNWAQQMRAALKPQTLRQATNLNALVHEWQLCSLLQNYDGPDTIQGITRYLRKDGRRQCYDWALSRQKLVEMLGLTPKQFGPWYADLLERYYREGFGRTWQAEHRQLVQAQAAETAQSLEQLPYSLLGFMEKHTGRKFQGRSKVIFYPSSFSRPQHAFGFDENGCKVVVYKVARHPAEAMGAAFHELLHSLLRGWRDQERVQQAVAELGKQPQFEQQTEPLRSSYDYPDGCLEEMLVHALGFYLCVKAGILTEAQARSHLYGPYQAAIYDAIFDRYEEFPLVDDFIFFALTHIQAAGGPGKQEWVYQR